MKGIESEPLRKGENQQPKEVSVPLYELSLVIDYAVAFEEVVYIPQSDEDVVAIPTEDVGAVNAQCRQAEYDQTAVPTPNTIQATTYLTYPNDRSWSNSSSLGSSGG